jgi:arylsulfatase A-like enzyme|tara:strand:- start:301 stop:2109 length:1809 start_codon:yes stop_codon:yes gene_type:complete
MTHTIKLQLRLLFLIGVCFSGFSQSETNKPNVIVVITDDQGYGDLACHGNPLIKTPAIDAFYEESVRLTDFHVGPTCAPTRAGLLTGRFANRTGVWHTIGGVSILREQEVTIANVFQDNDYETGLFGKWHLGDNYPSRPQDKGFDTAIYHGGGGVGQTPDYWQNDYFDDTYLVNGTPKKFEGYCTDVWFDEAIDFIKTNKNQPFLCWISTNAPHSPLNVPQEYYDIYKDLDIPEDQKKFYGMITNVDANFKKLTKQLKKLKLYDTTILVFMTDNGTAYGYKKLGGQFYGFNAGMTGTKNSEYEGGHRVPFFVSYPNGGISGGKDASELSANIDILPTLASLCGLTVNTPLPIDGKDISQVLTGEETTIGREYIITDSQRVQSPIKWRKSAVMSDKMRLVNGKELYDISLDPGQQNNLAKEEPEKVAQMRGYYEEWWTSVSSEFNRLPVIKVGSEMENPSIITCHDSHVHDSKIPWNQRFIRQAKKNPVGGHYTIEFEQSGRYQIELSRWPFEASLEINQGFRDSKEASENMDAVPNGRAMNFKSAILKIGAWKQEQPIEQGSKTVVFTGQFTKGLSNVSASMFLENNEEWGAYYIKIQHLKE